MPYLISDAENLRKLVIDFNQLHENIANIICDQHENERSEVIGLPAAFWALRIALEKKPITFQMSKFIILIPELGPEFAEVINLLRKYEITFTSFI